MNQQVTPIDLEIIDPETIKLCQDTRMIAAAFMQFSRRTIEKGLELGGNLNEIKAKLKHGLFMQYVQEIGLTQRVANHWMQKEEQYRHEITHMYNLPLMIEDPQSSVLDDTLDIKDPYHYSTPTDEVFDNANSHHTMSDKELADQIDLDFDGHTEPVETSRIVDQVFQPEQQQPPPTQDKTVKETPKPASPGKHAVLHPVGVNVWRVGISNSNHGVDFTAEQVLELYTQVDVHKDRLEREARIYGHDET